MDDMNNDDSESFVTGNSNIIDELSNQESNTENSEMNNLIKVIKNDPNDKPKRIKKPKDPPAIAAELGEDDLIPPTTAASKAPPTATTPATAAATPAIPVAAAKPTKPKWKGRMYKSDYARQDKERKAKRNAEMEKYIEEQKLIKAGKDPKEAAAEVAARVEAVA